MRHQHSNVNVTDTITYMVLQMFTLHTLYFVITSKCSVYNGVCEALVSIRSVINNTALKYLPDRLYIFHLLLLLLTASSYNVTCFNKL